VGAKLAHLHNLPQGQPERMRRTKAMVAAMDAAGFGACSNHFECEAACPKDIKRDVMALMNRDYLKVGLAYRDDKAKDDGGG
jgi:succinate dehydrogenase / fumarate reductase iron-sulfur subunit